MRRTSFLFLIGIPVLVLLTMAGCSSTITSNLEAAQTPSPSASKPVKVEVVGYIKHEPLQGVIETIKDTVEEYGDKVQVNWVDIETTEGSIYAALHHLESHMTILVDGKYECQANGKTVTFQGFEGGQWTKQDLDVVIANSINR